MKREQGRKLTSDEKTEMLKHIVELRVTGFTLTAIARELDCRYETVKKLWNSYLGNLEDVDRPKTIRERSTQAEAALLKALRDYHHGKNSMRDVKAAFDVADKYFIDPYLKQLQPTQDLPPILDLQVQEVSIELPPSEDFSDD
jgi:DNA-binding transcriptional MerR regulator